MPEKMLLWERKDLEILLAEFYENGKSASAVARQNSDPRKIPTDRLQGKYKVHNCELRGNKLLALFLTI